MTLSRRGFLAAGSAAIAVSAAPLLERPVFKLAAAAETEPTVLRVANRTIEVNGKPAKVYGLLQPDDRPGIVTPAGRFRVRLENQIEAPTLIHWHGLLPPYGQDGVPDLPQALLPSGQSYDYDFPLKTPGTHWMHAHTLQEQQLMAAPLIVTDPAEAARDEQQVVVLFHDFSFKSPEELLAGLRSNQVMSGMPSDGGMSGMEGMSTMPGHSMTSGTAMDINDIDYDAYLANDRTLDDPEIVGVEPHRPVRLRIINGSASTNFWIDLGQLNGQLLAVDGSDCVAVSGAGTLRGRRFPLAMSQRVDVMLAQLVPGAYPILARREGDTAQTGIILATPGAAIDRISARAAEPAPALTLDLERSLVPRTAPPARAADRRLARELTGTMMGFVWGLNGRKFGAHQPLPVRQGERVEIEIINRTDMSHPMHLHGHTFQVVAIDGQRLNGPLRDTVLVPVNGRVTIAFDAGNPGRWAFHCHNLYHMAAGMMTTVEYEA